MKSDLHLKTLDELTDFMGTADFGSTKLMEAHAEFQRRAALKNMEAACAAKEAAIAAQITSNWTRRSAIAICLSVLVMTIGVCLQLVTVYYTFPELAKILHIAK